MKRVLSVLALSSLLALGATAPARADQPHMEAALKSLQLAKDQLEKATEDKGGHRAKALKAVDVAINQVKKGVEFDRKNLSPTEKK